MKKLIGLICILLFTGVSLAIDQTLLLKLLELKRESYLSRRGELSLDIAASYSQDKYLVPWSVTKSYYYNLNTTLRLGVSDRLEVNLKVPFSSSLKEVFVTDWVNYRGNGAGDPSFNFQLEILSERINRPATYLTGGVRMPLARSSYDNPPPNEIVFGSGHYALNGGLSFLKSIDPCALYWGLEYQWVAPRENFNPADSVSYNMGLAWSLNQAVSLSLGLSGAVVGEDKRIVSGMETPVSSAYNITGLSLGSNVVVSPGLFLNPNLYMGLADEDTDFVFSLGLTLRM